MVKPKLFYPRTNSKNCMLNKYYHVRVLLEVSF